jgi:hypothetical protein
MAMTELWRFREPGWDDVDLEGFKVEALDGTIGHVVEMRKSMDGACIVIETGPWIFGKKVMLPAGIVDRLHPADETVYVERTKDAVKNAPQLDESRLDDTNYRDEISGYYAALGGARSVQV